MNMKERASECMSKDVLEGNELNTSEKSNMSF